jgi:hypothetical protein
VENYNKVELFKTYKDVCTRNELVNLYNKIHFDFNYFERYIRRDEENLVDADKIFLDINLNKILIQKFNYKKAILWRFKKLKD